MLHCEQSSRPSKLGERWTAMLQVFNYSLDNCGTHHIVIGDGGKLSLPAFLSERLENILSSYWQAYCLSNALLDVWTAQTSLALS